MMMAIQNLSKDTRQAIEFAEAEFARGTRFWPRLLIRCLEEIREGKALAVVQSFYARRCGGEPDASIEVWLHDLRSMSGANPIAEANRLRTRAAEIWDDSHCRSLTCRGVTRLYRAAADFLEHKLDEYEIELTRATGMLTASGDKARDDHEFDVIMQIVREEFEE